MSSQSSYRKYVVSVSKLEKLADSVSSNLDFHSLVQVVLRDVVFHIAPASSKASHHHYWDGGLAEHEEEVIRIMLNVNETLGGPVSKEQVFLAGLYHDYGKRWDYGKNAEGVWVPLPHKRNIHHVQRSAMEWHAASESIRPGNPENDEITHAILAHHGTPQWGSPVEPNSKLAWLLHFCDGISARLNDCHNDIRNH